MLRILMEALPVRCGRSWCSTRRSPRPGPPTQHLVKGEGPTQRPDRARGRCQNSDLAAGDFVVSVV